MTEPIFNDADMLYSNEIIDRINELDELRIENIISMDEANELDSLRSLSDAAIEYSRDWSYGVSLIRENYFTEYMTAFVEKMYGEELENMSEVFKKNLDWKSVTDHFKSDYANVTFDGVTYYVSRV